MIGTQSAKSIIFCLPTYFQLHLARFSLKAIRLLDESSTFYRSGGLDFDEFTGLLKDMHADEAVARRRMHTCELPASLLKEFSKVRRWPWGGQGQSETQAAPSGELPVLRFVFSTPLT